MKKTERVPLRYGHFLFEVPVGWNDDSTLSFSAPAKTGLVARMSPKKPPVFTSNLHVTLEERPEGVHDPIAFLELMGTALRSTGASVADAVAPKSFEMGGRKGAVVERKVVLNGQAMRQWVSVAFLAKNLIVASASTSESEAERERGLLLSLLAEVKYEEV